MAEKIYRGLKNKADTQDAKLGLLCVNETFISGGKEIKDLYHHFMLHLIKMKYSSRPGDSSDSQHVTFYP